jgi:HEAT repeat protein
MLKSKLNFALLVALLFASTVQLFGQTVPPPTKENVDKLIAVIKSDAPQKEKVDACRQLSVIGTKDAIAPLAALLGDEKLSHMARYALEPIPDPAVDDALRDAIGKLKGRPLVGVITSIGVRRDAKAVAALSKMLQDQDSDVVQAAARALGTIGNSAAAKALQGALANAPAANQLALCEGLFRCAEALAAKGQRDEAITIYDQLRNLQAPHQVRGGAVRGAILVRGKEGLSLLRQYLKSDDYILFSAAVQTSAELPGTEVTQVLAAELSRLPADNQILVMQALGNRRDAAALPTIVKTAKSGEVALRVTALKVLGQLGDASVVPTLFEAAVESNAEVAKAAQDTLVGLTSTKEVDAAILAVVEKGESKTRLVAIDVVAQRRMVTGNPLLFKVADDPEKQIRIAAIEALGQTGETKDLAGLVAMLVNRKNAEELRTTENAAKAVCGRSADKQACAEKLLAPLPQAQAEAKCALLRLLRVTGGADALQAVRAAIKDANAQIQETAIRTLCEWPTADAAPDLLEMARTSPNSSRKIAALRGYIGLVRDERLSTEKKIAMCREAAAMVERNEEKKLLLGVLGTVPAAEALSMAMVHIDNSATKDEASMAAVAISEKIVEQKPTEVADALQKVMQATDNKDVIRRAREILNKAKKTAGK